MTESVQTELNKCNDIFGNVAAIAKEALEKNNHGELLRCVSRFIHIQSRLERLRPTDPELVPLINGLLDFIYNVLIEVSD